MGADRILRPRTAHIRSEHFGFVADVVDENGQVESNYALASGPVLAHVAAGQRHLAEVIRGERIANRSTLGEHAIDLLNAAIATRSHPDLVRTLTSTDEVNAYLNELMPPRLASQWVARELASGIWTATQLDSDGWPGSGGTQVVLRDGRVYFMSSNPHFARKSDAIEYFSMILRTPDLSPLSRQSASDELARQADL